MDNSEKISPIRDSLIVVPIADFAIKEAHFKAAVAAEIKRLESLHLNLRALDPVNYLPEPLGGPGPLIEDDSEAGSGD